MEKEYDFGAFTGIAFFTEGEQFFSLEFDSSEVHYFYHEDDEKFLEKVDEICDIIYPDDWEELLDCILTDENKGDLLSKIEHDGGGDFYHCYCEDEATLIAYGTYINDLLKDKKRFLKYLKKIKQYSFT